MPAISATAPAKVILCGEHAVVYGRPAIAVPVAEVQARATVFADIRGKPGEVWIDAPDIQLSTRLADLPEKHIMTRLAALVAAELGISRYPALRLRIQSSIPIASGLGSGAAIAVAVIRALTAFLGHPLPAERINALAFETEKVLHGTPSGIDNTVVTYAEPIFFTKGQPFERVQVSMPFTLVIADTGIRSVTAAAVSGVRERWQRDPANYERLFDQIGQVARQARDLIESGQIQELGRCMNNNHALLQQLGVSCPELDQLVEAAREAGAWGAKLSGGGQGGNMIALVHPAQAHTIAAALQSAGATRVLVTTVKPK